MNSSTAPTTPMDRYLEAATRENTQRSYAAALRHFEVVWGGHLPASADSVARYLADHAAQLANNTLRQRLAALAHWHREHGFVDPTRAPLVRKVLKGIQTLHPSVENQAEPLQLTQLAQVDHWLGAGIEVAKERGDRADELRHHRDRSLILLGFWRGFRGDELIRLQVEHLRLVAGEGMTCFLSRSKGDRQALGTTYKVPALSRLCPVTATREWVEAAGLTQGSVFRSIDRWGRVSETSLHPNSLIPLLRRLLAAAGITDAEDYSSHSLRRGFAGWANANGWDVKALMEYVGWRDVQSALRYIDGGDPFARARIEASLPAPVVPSPAAPMTPEPPVQVTLELRMLLSPFTPRGRGAGKARRQIETLCLTPYHVQRLDPDGTHYRLTMHDEDATLEETVATILDEMHRIADNHQCFLEVSLQTADGRYWD